MRKFFKCLECGGEYSDTQADGTLYFHACPPERVVGEPPVAEKFAARRDENIKLGPAPEPGSPAKQEATITSEGKGRVPATAPA